MIEQTCPWELSKRLVNLGFSEESLYKWVHPYQSDLWKEDKSRYIIVDRISALDRKGYPAYGIGEILQNLPEEYILGRMRDEWCCKSFSDGWDDVIYYGSPILACVYAAIFMLEQKRGKKPDSGAKE
jgi:hypothetical protein